MGRVDPGEHAAGGEMAQVSAITAIETASNCQVRWFRGNVTEIEAALDCGSGPPTLPQPKVTCNIHLNNDGIGPPYCAPSGPRWVRLPG